MGGTGRLSRFLLGNFGLFLVAFAVSFRECRLRRRFSTFSRLFFFQEKNGWWYISVEKSRFQETQKRGFESKVLEN